MRSPTLLPRPRTATAQSKWANMLIGATPALPGALCRSRTLRAADGDDDVVEGDADGCLRLVDGDLDPLDPSVREHRVGDPRGQRLDEVDRVARDDGDDVRGHRRVVDGEGEVVAARRRSGVEGHDDVDDEVLAVAALLGEHPVEPPRPDAADRDRVAADVLAVVHSGTPAVRSASA